jgi:myo-inositol-1(or 4)-monophosphatase
MEKTASKVANNPLDLLERIVDALASTRTLFASFDRDRIEEMKKTGGDPVTAVDLEIDRILKQLLIRSGEGWLSEETADDARRLDRELVWIVDPLDGTREFIDGLPEYCTSIAAVVDGRPVAGGILNPASDLLIAGAVGHGVEANGQETAPLSADSLESMRVLASRSECARGQWQVVENQGIEVVPMGSVAYKMARVAAGLDHATWTPVPKHEWDVAGGAALLEAAGGSTLSIQAEPIGFNQTRPWLSGAIAVPPGFETHVPRVIELIAEQTA